MATNRVASSALRGEGVMVTLDDTETISVLPNLITGQKCTNGNSKIGYIYSVDYLGRSFIVMPDNPDHNFDSAATPAVLNVGETLTIV